MRSCPKAVIRDPAERGRINLLWQALVRMGCLPSMRLAVFAASRPVLQAAQQIRAFEDALRLRSRGWGCTRELVDIQVL